MNGKQLKNSILQWAIQGRLVPQDPNDEPASVLLERIRAEKARLVKEGKIKKDKNESIIFRGDDNSYYEKFLATGEVKCIDDEIPFEIPRGWEWVRLKMVATVARGGSPRPIKDYLTEASNGVNWIKIGDTEKGGKYIKSSREKIKPEGVSKSRLIHKGDFLLTNSMSFGRPYISDIDGCIHDGWLVISPTCDSYSSDFLFYLLSSRFAYDQFCGKVSGAVVQNLNSDKVADAIFPLPPYEEQQRIISILEQGLPYIEQYSNAQESLDLLNLSINQSLRKSILQEAIQGKLVPQDPADEPASVLLERIREEKLRLIKEGKLKKKDITDSIIFKGTDNKYYEKIGNETVCIDEEIPFDIPQSWSWTRLGFLVSNETGLSYSKDCLSEKSSRMIRVLRGGNIEEGRWLTKDDDVMISASYVKDELILKRGTFITPAVTSIERMAKTALIEVDQSDIVVGGFVLMLKPFIKDDSLLRYLILLFQSVYYKQYCTSITNKSGQAFYNLSRQKLMKCLVPIAPMKEMSRIVEKIASLNL